MSLERNNSKRSTSYSTTPSVATEMSIQTCSSRESDREPSGAGTPYFGSSRNPFSEGICSVGLDFSSRTVVESPFGAGISAGPGPASADGFAAATGPLHRSLDGAHGDLGLASGAPSAAQPPMPSGDDVDGGGSGPRSAGCTADSPPAAGAAAPLGAGVGLAAAPAAR